MDIGPDGDLSRSPSMAVSEAGVLNGPFTIADAVP
jgi:hypothetical protein